MKEGLLVLTLLAISLSGTAHADSAATKQSLTKLDVQSTNIQPSPVSGMNTVLTDSGILYVTDDGKHATQGPMHDVNGTQPVDVTGQLLIGKLNALNNEMIVCKAPKEQHVITVFTDITCSYCHKLYEQMGDYNALGITVRYLAFPRQGLQSRAEQGVKAIWYARDHSKVPDGTMNGKSVQPASCNVDIVRHYTLGMRMGVNDTPTMVLNNGMMSPGYQGPREPKAFLDEHKKQTSGN